MPHARSIVSPAEALFQVFCLNTTSPSITRLSSHRRACMTQFRTTAQTRHASFTRSRNSLTSGSPRVTIDPFPDVVRDSAIMARYVRMPAPEGGLTELESLRSALSRIKEGTEHLVQIAKVDDDGMAICRIMTIADLIKQKRDKERIQKEHKKSLKQSVPKQIELNWAISSNDLEHKLTQLKSFIEDGKKVEVVLASRKRQRLATLEEGEEVLRKVRQMLAEADAREIKAMEGGEVGKHTMLTVRKKGLE